MNLDPFFIFDQNQPKGLTLDQLINQALDKRLEGIEDRILDRILARKEAGTIKPCPATAKGPRLTEKTSIIIGTIPCDEPESTIIQDAMQDPHTAEGIMASIKAAGVFIKDGTVQSTLYTLRQMGCIQAKPVEIIRPITKTAIREAHSRTKAGFAYWQLSVEDTKRKYLGEK